MTEVLLYSVGTAPSPRLQGTRLPAPLSRQPFGARGATVKVDAIDEDAAVMLLFSHVVSAQRASRAGLTVGVESALRSASPGP